MLPVSLQVQTQLQAKAELERRRRLATPRPDPWWINPDPVAWILEHFRIPETADRRFPLQPYQQRALLEALSRDETGAFCYSVILWSDIKKSAKSVVTAAVALWRAFQVEWGSVVLVANDLKQADSRVGYYIRRAIELNPRLKDICRVVRNSTVLPNHALIESVPIDPSGEAGGGADMVVFSELWGAHQEAKKRMWTEMTLSPLKFGQSFRWVESYAGYSGESTLLEGLYEVGVKGGVQVPWAGEFSPPLEAFTTPGTRHFTLWNTVPRCPWQTREYYAQEETDLDPNEFRRVHRNEFISSVSAFVPAAWWEACRLPELPPLEKNQPAMVVLDAAVSGDTFGVLVVTGRRGYKDPSHYSDAGFVDVRFAHAWRPPEGGKLDFSLIEAEVRDLLVRFSTIELVYDPYQLHDMGSRFQTGLLANTYEFSQGAERLVADKALQDKIRDRRVGHLGDSDLTAHIQNANSKAEADNKLRIVKRSDLLKIDLAVCLSMGASRLEFWNL